MLLSEAVALATARSYLAALADAALTFEGSLGYDRVLLDLDTIHGDDTPATFDVSTTDRSALYDLAEIAVEQLGRFEVDALQVELLLARLEDARRLDGP